MVRGYGARFFAEQNLASDEKCATSIFGSGATGQAFWRRKISQAMKSWQKVFFGIFFYENPNPDPTFFVCVKLLISLLNGAFFRLGDNFSVRGYGARFSAADHQQLFKQMVGTPYGFCCAAGLGNFAIWEKVFFGPQLQGKLLP